MLATKNATAERKRRRPYKYIYINVQRDELSEFTHVCQHKRVLVPQFSKYRSKILYKMKFLYEKLFFYWAEIFTKFFI